MTTRRILVTSALPYANGPIHIGHLVEYIQTDIWVRFQKLAGNDCVYVCAEDTHGTPVMLKARELDIAPEELIDRMATEHRRDFADFSIEFDNFYTTHSPETRELTESIYQRLRAAGHIENRTIRQAFDEQEQLFLPDRYVRGTCPRCRTPDQYGDSCENCGATYSPAELLDPVSVLSGTKPVQRESEHFFFRLGDFSEMLSKWIDSGRLHPAAVSKLREWFDAGLNDWDISRDEPYFGFEIPGAPGKYFYVWFDAPIGYLASFRNLCERREDLDFDDYLKPDSEIELYHFIGKDIIYFHALFWPAVLHGSGYRTPTSVFPHGFLTVDGLKMSKRRGTYITARCYLDHLGAECLRYYYAAKLGPSIDDINLNLSDFVQRVNSDLVGKFVNIASRCAGFINKRFDGQLADTLENRELYDEFVRAGESVATHYDGRDYNRALREIMQLADRANQYIDGKKPWVLARDDKTLPEVQLVSTQGLNLFRLLLIFLKPILPQLAEKAEGFLGVGPLRWADSAIPLLGDQISAYEPLMSRIDSDQVERMVEASREGDAEVASENEPGQIDYGDFAKLDLRAARILEANYVDGADKLLQLTVDLGDSQRQVFAGIRSAYDPEQLVGRMTVVVANLKPKKMRFGVSEGMVLCAGDGDTLYLIQPDDGAEPGMRVT